MFVWLFVFVPAAIIHVWLKYYRYSVKTPSLFNQCFRHFQEFFPHTHEDITIAGEELYSVIMALSSEGFLASNNYCEPA